MAITAQTDSREWEQEEHVPALFRADYDRWSGCRQPEMLPGDAWVDKKSRIVASAHDSIVIYGHGTGKSSAFISNCLRTFWGRHVISSGITRGRYYETEQLRPKFKTLADEWRRDTRFSSSSDEKILHPAYQTIMTMGSAAVPLVLENLEASRGHWFWALHFMTGADPVPEGANVNEARDAWLAWGKQQGLLR